MWWYKKAGLGPWRGEGRQAALKSGDRAVSAGVRSCSGKYTDVEEACADGQRVRARWR